MAALITDPEDAKRIADLDAQDKILRQQRTKQTELSKAAAYIGSCDDMCPERERLTRWGGLQLSIFERDERNQPAKHAMIKEYRRAGADQEEPLPHDLRTPEALENTMHYLLSRIMDDPRSKAPELALEWYDFLWDRLRAIRKDITQQNICDQAAAKLVERCVRFHVHSCYALNRIKNFDTDMNKRNLNDCLQMLRQMYNDLQSTGVICEGQVEFQKYDVLLHLDENSLSTTVTMKTSDYRSSDEMKFITRIFNAYTNNDYYKFFKLMEEADYMTSCILALYVNKVRLRGIKIIAAACGTSKQVTWYPTDIAIDSLAFDGLEDLAAFASSLDISIQEKDSKHYLLLNKDLVASLRVAGSSMTPVRSHRLIESKMNGRSVGLLVSGSAEIPKVMLRPLRQQPKLETALIPPKIEPQIPYLNQFPKLPQLPRAPPVQPPQPTLIHQPRQLRPRKPRQAKQQLQLPFQTQPEAQPEPQKEVISVVREPEAEPQPVLQKEEHVEEEIIPIGKSRDEVADIMPAGRFKRALRSSRLKRPMSQIEQPSLSENTRPPPKKKSSNQRSELAEIESIIHDEKIAGKSFLDMIRLFS